MSGLPDHDGSQRMNRTLPFVREHADNCRITKAATCALPVECSHGYDLCPTCDPCTCGKRKVAVAPEMNRATTRGQYRSARRLARLTVALGGE